MAIINSLAIGTGRKSMGGITYTKLKGQQIAKQQVPKKGKISVANRSPAQNRMSNAVLAYQFLAAFLVHINALRTSVESNFNAFVRLSVLEMSDIVAITRVSAAAMLSAKSIGLSSFVTVLGYVFNVTKYDIAFTTGGLPFLAGTYINFITFNTDDGTNLVLNHLITEAEWTAQLASITHANFGGNSSGAYAYNTTSNKCSNISFMES